VGAVEDWNRSSIALRGLRALRPSDYMKPPFHTYFNPRVGGLANRRSYEIAQVPKDRIKIANPAKLIDRGLLTIALYLGTIALAYSFSRSSYGRFLLLSSRSPSPRAPDLLLMPISSPWICRSCSGMLARFGREPARISPQHAELRNCWLFDRHRNRN